MGLLPRVKTWVSTEDVTYSDLNAEFDNILDNFGPSYVDDYSANTNQMKTQTDPGEVGSESLSTTLAGEIARIRYALAELKGTDYWYETSSYTLESLGTALGGGLPNNRIISGRDRSGASPASSQAIFLVPAGNARTVTVKGTTTNLVYTIAGVQYTISTDVQLTSLTAAPSTNNTCLVNDAAMSAQNWTKYVGQFGSTLTVDNMGSEISALAGKLCGFKLTHSGTDEYFIARVDSSTKLSNIQRGIFFDSSDNPHARVAISDNDTITLMKLSWIFAKDDGTLTVSYGNPRIGKDEPVSPASGDYWFDTVADIWKVYSATTWDDAGAILIGVCMQDSTNTVAARSFDFFKAFRADNNVALTYYDATEVRARTRGASISVYGSTINFTEDFVRWDIDTDLDTGAEAASTLYFLYLTESGESLISLTAPCYFSERKGLYHPNHTHRCLGQVYNNASSNFEAVISYHDESETNYKMTHAVAASALTVKVHGNPLTEFKFTDPTTSSGEFTTAALLPDMALTISSGSTLGTSDATDATLCVHGISYENRIEIGISQAPHKNNSVGNTSAEGGAGAADNVTTLYTEAARTSVPIRQLFKANSNQTTAGTWAAALTSVTKFPFKYICRQSITSTSTITTPAGHYICEIWGSGGGGGGGGGSTTNYSPAPGGGGGAPIYMIKQSIVPLDSLVITIGAGGNGGAVNNNGTSGTSSTIVGTGVSLTFLGGGYGGGCSGTSCNPGGNSLGAGGYRLSTSGVNYSGGGGGGTGIGGISNQGSTTNCAGVNGGGGAGGYNTVAGGSGGSSVLYSTGGAGGAASGGYCGGGGGGSSWGVGGAGGAASSGGTASAGSAAAANSGGGGGGGGAGFSSGAAGGAGGSGKVVIFWES